MPEIDPISDNGVRSAQTNDDVLSDEPSERADPGVSTEEPDFPLIDLYYFGHGGTVHHTPNVQILGTNPTGVLIAEPYHQGDGLSTHRVHYSWFAVQRIVYL